MVRREGESSASPEIYREAGVDAFACPVEYRGGDAAHVHVRGELDIGTAGQLAEALHEALSRAKLVVVDLSRLTFIDCIGLGAIVAAHNRALRTQRQLVLSSVTAQVSRLLDITGTAERFALTSLTAPLDTVGQELDSGVRS